jgi:hypothetical protein
MLRRLSRVLGLWCLTACGTDPEDFGRCAGGLALSVSGNAAPEFTWTPADCPINDLVVEQASVIHWSLASLRPGKRNPAPRALRRAGAPRDHRWWGGCSIDTGESLPGAGVSHR